MPVVEAFVCWAPKHKHQDIKESVKVKTWVDVKFGRTGSQVIFLNSLMYSNITSLVSILTSQDFLQDFDSWSKSIASYLRVVLTLVSYNDILKWWFSC